MLILPIYYLSCNTELPDKVDQIPDSSRIEKDRKNVAYRVIANEDSSFGYDIYLDNIIYIHQPIIPHYTGWKGFETTEEASRMANFLVNRLKQNYPHFILTKVQADSLLSIPDATSERRYAYQKVIYAALSRDRLFGGPSLQNDTNRHLLPELPDPPVKMAWRSMGRVPFGKRSSTSSFTIGDWIYIGSGEHNDQLTNDFWAYDTRTGSWTCLAMIPESGMFSCISFSINGKGYMGLGTIKSSTAFGFHSDFFEYDPLTNSWTAKANFPGPPRIDAAYFVINGKGYAGLGFSGKHEQDFYEYDPVKNHWKKLKDFLGGPVSAASGISAFGKGFVTCGDNPTESKRFLFEYLPETDSWVQHEDFPGKPRYYLNGNGIDSNIFMAGGGRAKGGIVNYRDYYLYNTQTGKWTGLPDYLIGPEGISRTGGGNVNGHIYAGTGYNGFFQDDWNVFDYYYTTRKDTGLYDEGVCYPMKYDGSWELYQECAEGNCYAGIAIKSGEKLGKLCYSSKIGSDLKSGIEILDKQAVLIPRIFRISTDKAPSRPYMIRLFFPRNAFEHIVDRKTAIGFEPYPSNIKILVYDKKKSILGSISDSEQIRLSKIITPTLYGYGFEQETWVAECMVNSGNLILRIEVMAN